MTDLISELKTIDRRLMELEKEKEQLQNRRDLLVKQISSQNSNQGNSSQNLSTAEKINLFKSYFFGRDDVFATRWENVNGRSGYSIACNNEWKSGICLKPKVKCGECQHKRFKKLDEQVIYDHLAGKVIAGIYPLFSDNSCRLLAIDFDKDDWREAVKATSQVCKQFNLHYLIEISRSGNGAHLWLFFSENVPAKNARLLGSRLLDKAMEIYPNLTFDSYDRLFPNQDIMPEGGFGNLIALPLQYEARQQGNSVFVDDNLQPFPDQWMCLSKLRTLTPGSLNKFIDEITTQPFDDSLPWEQGRIEPDQPIENCPREVTLTLANHIYIQVEDLPAKLIARLKRLASFSNPVFYKTQALRFSTHGKPRYISCAHMERGYLSLPRGCLDDTLETLEQQDIKVTIDDRRQQGTKLKALKFLGRLRTNQSKTTRIMTKHDNGVLHAPTAFGKTVTAIAIICARGVNTLILTHNRQLVDQWKERLSSFISGADIGVFTGGKKKPTFQIDVATYQSLINRKNNTVNPLIQKYGQIIVDECHHISAPNFEMVLNEAHCKYVMGLTATPDRQDGHQKIIFMLAGPIRHKISSDHADKFDLEVRVKQLYSKPAQNLVDPDQRPRIADVYRWLTEDNERTKIIVKHIVEQVQEGRHPLVLQRTPESCANHPPDA